MEENNVLMQLNGSILVITVDLSQTLGVSQSGKSEIIATTSGNVSLPGVEDIKIGVNVYRPRKQHSRGF